MSRLTEWINQSPNRRILGINPPVYDFAWFDLWAKPLGLLNVLGYFRERGHEVELLDCLDQARTRPLNYGRWKVRRREIDKPAALSRIPRPYYRFGLEPDEIRARLTDRPGPDFILVTSIMTYWYPGVFEIIGLMKKIFPGTPVILGGIYAALCPEHAARSGADHLMIDGPPLRPAATALDLYERPDHAVLATSYGCPGRCGYCASQKLNGPFQARPLAEVRADIDGQLASGRIKDLAFYDDALLWERDRLFRPLCEHLAAYSGLRLHSPNGLAVAAIDEDCAGVMFRAGFRTLRLSLEGLDPRTRSLSGQKAGRQEHQRAVAKLLKAGFPPDSIETYLLLGLPGQRAAEVEAAIDYVKSVGSRPKLCEFSPIPGTPLFEREAAERPLIAVEPLWHNNSLYTPHLSGRVPPEELQRLKNLSRSK